jgi:hypothetical protein
MKWSMRLLKSSVVLARFSINNQVLTKGVFEAIR